MTGTVPGRHGGRRAAPGRAAEVTPGSAGRASGRAQSARNPETRLGPTTPPGCGFDHVVGDAVGRAAVIHACQNGQERHHDDSAAGAEQPRQDASEQPPRTRGRGCGGPSRRDPGFPATGVDSASSASPTPRRIRLPAIPRLTTAILASAEGRGGGVLRPPHGSARAPEADEHRLRLGSGNLDGAQERAPGGRDRPVPSGSDLVPVLLAAVSGELRGNWRGNA